MLIKELEVLVSREYKKANRAIGHKADDYFRRFEAKDKIKRDQLRRKVITMQEYIQWRQGQLIVGSRWEKMRLTLAEDFHHANEIAAQTIKGGMPEIYALNHSYSTYQIEHGLTIDTSYTLYNRDAVEAVLNDLPLLPREIKHGQFPDVRTSTEYTMPELGKKAAQRIREGRDVLWNVQQIQSVMLQGILQGVSIPELAGMLEIVTERNHNAAIRNARTMATNVQNAGRQAAYKRAASYGVKMKRTWYASLDFRTRHAHRLLHGQTVGLDEPFEVDGAEIDYPGDPHAPARLVYNCRCTTVPQLLGFESNVRDFTNLNSKLGDMTYQEWLDSKVESDPIQKQEWIAKIMKGKYARDYKR